MLTKTTKIASALALALVAGNALAANTIAVSESYDSAKANTGVITTVNERIQAGNASLEIETVAAALTASHFITYHADTSGVLNSGFLKYTFASGVSLFSNVGANDFFLLRTSSAGVDIDGAGDGDLETVGTVFAVDVDGNGDYTSVTFQIKASANIGVDDVLVLATAEDTNGDTNPDVAATVRLLVDSGVTLSSTATTSFGLTVEGQTPSAGAHSASNASGNIISSSPALVATASANATSKVDLSDSSETFLTEGYVVTVNDGKDTDAMKSASRGLILNQTNAGVDFPTTLDVNDKIEIIVSTTDDCGAVNGADGALDLNAVRAFDVASGTSFTNMSVNAVNAPNGDHDDCTFTISGDFTGGGLSTDLDLAAGVGIEILTDGANESDIVSSTYNTQLRVDFNSNVTAGDWVEYTNQTSHTWDATISGPVAITPYIYAFNDSSSTNSLIEIANYAGVDRDVAVKVNLVEIQFTTGGIVRTNKGSFSDYYLGEASADAVSQFTADNIIDLLISPSTVKTADDGYNVTPVALDKSRLYHMSVEFTLVDDGDLNASAVKTADNDNWHIAIQNKSGDSRANAPVHYEGATDPTTTIQREGFSN